MASHSREGSTQYCSNCSYYMASPSHEEPTPSSLSSHVINNMTQIDSADTAVKSEQRNRHSSDQIDTDGAESSLTHESSNGFNLHDENVIADDIGDGGSYDEGGGKWLSLIRQYASL